LYIATAYKRADVAAILLQSGPSLCNTPCAYGYTPLHLACANGSLDIVLLLLSFGANVNITDTRSGTTPLHIACLHGFDSIANELVDAGALLDVKDVDGQTPFDVAIHVGNQKLVDALLARCGPGAGTKSAV
jgi:uncharacterized protein